MRRRCTLISINGDVFATLLNQLPFGPKCVLLVVKDVLVIVRTATVLRSFQVQVKEAGLEQSISESMARELGVQSHNPSLSTISTLQLCCLLIRLRCLLAF